MENDRFHTEVSSENFALAFAIVVYQEPYYQSIAYTTLLESLKCSGREFKTHIFIYDNTDIPNWNMGVTDEIPDRPVSYFQNPANPGISVAYNFLAAKARNLEFYWMVFLDQDSSLPKNAVDKYLDAIKNHPDVLVKAPVLTVNQKIFSPSKVIFKRSVLLNKINPGIHALNGYTMVNSGLLLNLELFFQAGGYNEMLRVDFADFIFIDKLRSLISEFELLDFKCVQQFSDTEKDIRKALGRYAIFIKDLSNCPRENMADSIGYFLVGALHLAKLSFKFRSLKFILLHFNQASS